MSVAFEVLQIVWESSTKSYLIPTYLILNGLFLAVLVIKVFAAVGLNSQKTTSILVAAWQAFQDRDSVKVSELFHRIHDGSPEAGLRTISFSQDEMAPKSLAAVLRLADEKFEYRLANLNAIVALIATLRDASVVFAFLDLFIFSAHLLKDLALAKTSPFWATAEGIGEHLQLIIIIIIYILFLYLLLIVLRFRLARREANWKLFRQRMMAVCPKAAPAGEEAD